MTSENDEGGPAAEERDRPVALGDHPIPSNLPSGPAEGLDLHQETEQAAAELGIAVPRGFLHLGSGEAMSVGTAADMRAASAILDRLAGAPVAECWAKAHERDGRPLDELLAEMEEKHDGKPVIWNMGASNVVAAYAKYAGRVPPLSMVLLAYMAVVSKDNDPEPWFGMGHQALAQYALGRPAPIQRADIKAVERAIDPLKDAGAIVADRRAAPRREGSKTVRYRLNLRLDIPRNPGDDSPLFPRNSGEDSSLAPDVPRIPGDDSGYPQGDSATSDPGEERPPESVPNVPRIPASRPPDSGQSSPDNRGTEEQEEEGGAKGGREKNLRNARYRSARASEANGVSNSPAPPGERPAYRACACGAALDPDGSCFMCRTPPPPNPRLAQAAAKAQRLLNEGHAR